MHENESQDSRFNEPEHERFTAFGFTYNEKLFDVVGNKRFLELIQSEETTIHQAEVSSNMFGEFLFVTASRSKSNGHEMVSFWGLGFHEHRDRYLLNEWYWYTSEYYPGKVETLDKREFLALIFKRRKEIEPFAREHDQSSRGKLYEVLADLTDEDAAASEIDVLENLLDDL